MISNILLFDIETTHLKANFGTVLCFGSKWLDAPTVTVDSITDRRGWRKDFTDDSHLVKAAAEKLTQADLWVSYYGKMFDAPYLQSKLLEYGLPALPNVPHVDIYFTAKQHLQSTSRRLDTVGKYLNCKTKKTPVDGRIWKQAMAGSKDAIEYVVKHCYNDVLLLEEVYLKLRGLVRTHPRVGAALACRHCGAFRLTAQKNRLTVKRGPTKGVKCTACGAWDTFPLKEWEAAKGVQHG